MLGEIWLRLGKWLTKFKVWSPVFGLGQNAFVSELIDSDTKMWNRIKILNKFTNYEAQQILSFPLSWRLPIDKITWHWEKDGNFSMRSPYHLKVPNYVCNFLSRLAKRILPTRGRLEKKGLNTKPTPSISMEKKFMNVSLCTAP